jgi:hypothetical protein
MRELIKKILKEERKLSTYLIRRLHMLDYEVESGLNGPFGGSNICIFFKSDVEFFESVMENAIDAMYYNHFSHIDDGSGEWAHEYLDMVDYIRNKYKDKIIKYYNDNCGSGSIPLKESIRRILREDEYSPAGKEIIPNKIVIHKSNPKNRDRILEQGLKVRAGECYKTYAGYGEKCIPAIFATNSVNKRAWFDSSYDDDIWEIDTTMIPDVKWYKDNHYEPTKKHIVTFENIPSEALTLKYEGTESGLMRESKNETKNINAAKEIINSMFDNVSFLEVKSKEKIIKVYFETISTAMNEDSWFVNVICDTIKDYTSLKAIPLWWRGSVTDKDVDIYIDTEIVRYDEEGNLINESKEKEPKFLNLII